MKPYPYFEQDEIDAVVRVLKSGKVNQWTGNEVKTFEKSFARFIGTKYAVAVMNGSIALELALVALGIGKGDEVIVPNRTFIASASCVAMRRATPVFADIDRESQNITFNTFRNLITSKTKAIICVHLAGWGCDMIEMTGFALNKGLYIIEDCAQALGGKYRGIMLGKMGHIGTFSFCQDKIMTTGGEGGMLVTDNEEWYRKAWSYKDHGKNPNFYLDGKEGEYYYTSLGTNWRMTEMQAAIGNVALPKVDRWVKKRQEYARMLNEGLKDVKGIRLTIPPDHIKHAYYKYYIFVDENKRDWVIKKLNAKGVPCGFGSAWAHSRHVIWGKSGLFGYLSNDCELGQTAVAFNIHHRLTVADIKNMIKVIKEVFNE